ncbi:MAG: hypothetical protein JXA11_07250 [Phycisphaerae bacterium]|nr:hypothetical protein [Phycisphaerae bacterium]
MDTTQTLSLEKDGHLYLFRYTRGSEDALVEELMYLADEPSLNFDWMDAAALSFQVTCESAREFGNEMEPDELAME